MKRRGEATVYNRPRRACEELQRLTRSTPGLTAWLAVVWFVGVGCRRPSGRRARRRRSRAPWLNSFCRKSKERMAMTMVSSARLGEVLFDGDDRRPYGLGFRLGQNLSRGRRISGLGYTVVFIRSLNVPCHADGRGDGANARGNVARRLAGLPYTKRMRMSLSPDI